MDDLALTDRGEQELFLSCVPSFRGVGDWQDVFRRAHVASGGAVVRRRLWEQAANRSRRLLVDVAECRTPDTARSRLKAVTRDSNVRFADIPDRLGHGALANVDQQPRSVYFLRANLLIWALCCAREYFDVLACADRIAADLDSPAPPDAGDDLVLTRQSDSRESPGAICLSVKPRWERGEWARIKLTAEGGTLARAMEGDGLLLWPAHGEPRISVRGWVMEPGRKTYGGQYIHQP